jgi:hypothetical protein
MYRCPWRNSQTGTPCGNRTPYSRKWNLQRHMERRHGTSMAAYVPLQRTFVNMTPATFTDTGQQREAAVASSPSHSALSPATATLWLAAASPPPHLESAAGSDPSDDVSADSDLAPPPLSSPPVETDPSQLASPVAPGSHDWPNGDGQGERVDGDAVDCDVAPSVRKRSWDGAALRQRVPEYDTKRSKLVPDQQRAIMWMTGQGKQHFDQHFGAILAQWGVALTHRGTCISLPADWAALSPTTLMGIFDYSKCPLANTERAVSS